MKIKSSVRKLCKNCRLIKRNRQLRIICINPKHKRRQN